MKKSFIILILLFFMPSTMVLAGSSSEYFRSMLNSGIAAYQNGNFEEALYIFEMCGNQHNINRYADKCRNNIPKVKKMIADKAAEEKRIVDAKAAEEERKTCLLSFLRTAVSHGCFHLHPQPPLHPDLKSNGAFKKPNKTVCM